MPPLAGALAIAIFEVGVVTFGTAIFLANAAVAIIGSIALNAISSAIFGKSKTPERPNFSNAAFTRTQVVRSSAAFRQTVYGEVPVSGPLAFVHAGGLSTSHLHMVILLADHEVQEIGDLWFNDDRIPARDVDSGGNVTTGKFANQARISKHLGTNDQLADADLVAEVPEWTNEHRLRGIAYVYVRFSHSASAFPTGIPNIKALVKGKKVFDPRDLVVRYSDNPALCIRDYLTSPAGLGSATTEIDDAQAAAAANICDERVALTTVTDSFTVDDADDDRLLHASDMDWQKFHTGERVTVSSSESPDALPGGLVFGQYYYIRLDTGFFKLASSYQDAIEGTAVDVTSDGSGSHSIRLDDQPRYTLEGTVTTEKTPIDAIEEMATAMAGVAVWQSGAYRLYAAAADVATATLTASDLRGPVKMRARPERRNLFNRVSLQFVDQDNFWQPSDAPPVENATYVAQDGGDELNRDVELPFTTDAAMAQRLGKIHLEKSRQGITVELPCKWTVLRLAVWDTVNITLAEFGWSAKKFRIINWTMAGDLGGIDLVCQEEADASYDWNNGDATVHDPAPDTTLPNPFSVGAVANLSLASGTAQLLTLSEGSIISRILASWDALDDPFIDRYEVQFKKSADSDWTPAGVTDSGTTSFFIAPTEDGTQYDLRVRGINNFNAAGAFNTVLNHVVVGKTEPPTSVNAFTVVRLADGTRRYSWTHDPVPADVRSGGGYKIRFASGVTSDWESMTALHTGLLTASPFENNELAAGTYTFAIKAVDSSNNESTDAVFTTVTIGDPRLREVLLQRLEHTLGWPGTKTDSFVVGSQLVAATSLGIGDLPATIGALAPTIEDMVPRTSPIVYETPEIDLGTDISFTPLVTLTGVGDFVTSIKTGSSTDGGVVGAYDSLGPVSLKRYLQFRFRAGSEASPNSALRIDTATILLDGAAVIDAFEDVDTATEAASWFERVGPGHFRIAPRSADIATITSASIRAIQSAGLALTWELVAKNVALTGSPSRLGAEFKIHDPIGSPSLVDAVVDVELKGPSAG